MTEVRDPAIARMLAVARTQFASTLPAKVADLRKLVDVKAWDGARRAAHKLRGSAGSYGFAAVSTACGAIEDGLLAVDLKPTTELEACIGKHLGDAATEAERASLGSAGASP